MQRTLFLPLLCTSLLVAQDLPPDIVPPFVVTTERVVVPVTVYDRNGGFVSGIEGDKFRLYDNGKEQDIQVDVSYQPLSLVIAIESSSHVEAMLPQIQKIGNLISPLVIGDQGEAAVVAFDSRVRTLQDFTSNPDLITQAVKKIMPGSDNNRIVDAAVESARMLSHRPPNRRRIILDIAETRDLGSESRAREALIDLQLGNIEFYSVDMSRLLSTLSAPTEPPRPPSQPPTAYSLPGGVPATPSNVQSVYGYNGQRAEFMPLMLEILKDVKYIFKDNPMELFTKGTGGTEFPYYTRRGLEDAIEKIGEELHSQYILTYSPNNKLEGGFHQILVEVEGHPEVKKVLTRPGYWLAAKPG